MRARELLRTCRCVPLQTDHFRKLIPSSFKGHWQAALDSFSKALSTAKIPDLLIKRASCYLNLQLLEAALKDAHEAVTLDVCQIFCSNPTIVKLVI